MFPLRFWSTPSSFMLLPTLFPSLLLLHSPEWLIIFQVPIQTLILQRSLPWLSDLRCHLLATFSNNTCFYLYKVQLFACCISQTSPEKQNQELRERQSAISIAITIYLCLYLYIYICIDLYLYLYRFIFVYLYLYRFIIGIGSNDHGGWEAPCSAVCKLQNQKRKWYN